MIRDALLQFCGSAPSFIQDLTGAAVGTVPSTNIIDLGVLSGIPSSANGGGGRDMGIGDDPAMKVHVLVVTPFAGGATLQVQVMGAPDNGAGAPGAFTPYAISPVVPATDLAIAGARLFDIDMPRSNVMLPPPRYLELGFIVAGAAPTAGSLIGELVLDRFDQPWGAPGFASGYVPGVVVNN